MIHPKFLNIQEKLQHEVGALKMFVEGIQMSGCKGHSISLVSYPLEHWDRCPPAEDQQNASVVEQVGFNISTARRLDPTDISLSVGKDLL